MLALAIAALVPSALPRCVVAVAGANGRVGSMVVRELLRNHPQVQVRALVRDATQAYQGYGRLSYEVGAEDGKMEIKSAFRIDDESGRFASPATMEFDEEVQRSYGLDRLEIRECELRFRQDVDAAIGDADGVIWCATAFSTLRQRLPDRLDNAAGKVASAGMALFELRLGDALFGKPSADGLDEERAAESRDKLADVEGLEIAVDVLGKARKRRASLAELTGQAGAALTGKLGVQLVLASAGSALGYDENPVSQELRENEFGYRKRLGEEAVRGSTVLSTVIVRSAALDDLRVDEGLPPTVQESDVARGGTDRAVDRDRETEARRRRIHPRDLASVLVASLAGRSPATSSDASSTTVDAWTFVQK